jgi:hypothetical protein
MSFRWDVLDQRLHRTLDERPKDRIGISPAGACHTDRLGENPDRVGSPSGDALGSSDQVIDDWVRSLWHDA